MASFSSLCGSCVPSAGSSIPACSASIRTVSVNPSPSTFITNEIASPPSPHPKHLKMPIPGFTLNDGVFSLWNGQRPLKLVPAFLRRT